MLLWKKFVINLHGKSSIRIRIARMNCTKDSFNFKLYPVKNGEEWDTQEREGGDIRTGQRGIMQKGSHTSKDVHKDRVRSSVCVPFPNFSPLAGMFSHVYCILLFQTSRGLYVLTYFYFSLY